MKSFKEFLAEKCWPGYKKKGTKILFGKRYPNCVKEEEELNKSVPSVDDLAKKYKMSILDIRDLVTQGTNVEMEHTDEKHVARKIALTHIGERSDYYKKLKKYVEETKLDEVAAWQRKEGKSESGGLNRKGVESYRRENPGSKLQTAVTTEPSKLDPDSKAAKRRKSFCSRMSGMKKRLTSSKTANDPDSRINKALRKWNC